jgi:hypothetical protein
MWQSPNFQLSSRGLFGLVILTVNARSLVMEQAKPAEGGRLAPSRPVFRLLRPASLPARPLHGIRQQLAEVRLAMRGSVVTRCNADDT